MHTLDQSIETPDMADDGRVGRRGPRDKTRATNPCDGCALRRVRCEGGRPCKECQKRFLACTSLRVARKRGPKGPRTSTTQKVRSLQRQLQLTDGLDSQDQADCDGSHSGRSPPSPGSCASAPSPGIRRMSLAVAGPYPKHTPLPLETYCKFLGVFRERLYSVWPVLCCGSLITRLVSDEHDYESWALAASVCAGVIAQLRLPEHTQPSNTSSSSSSVPPLSSASSDRRQSIGSTETTSARFAADAEHFRRCYDYRERPSVFSLLASFFLHIYCANSDLLRTAGFHLRESLTQAHMLSLHRPETYLDLLSDEKETRLRVYWVLFVSERTYCIQHGLPTILRPISLRPSPNEGPDGCSGSPILSFLYLTKLFTFLDGDLIEPPSSMSAQGTTTAVTAASLVDDPIDKQRARNKVTVFQSDLGSTAEGVGLDETQRVDIFVTRNWIRILLWEYTVRHFTMSCSADDHAFSILLPALVSHEMLGLFSAVSGKSICAHGYGMELKVFRIADSLLDVLACRRPVGQSDSMLLGSRDALHSLEKVLSTVGGRDSLFLGKLRQRMAEVQLPVATSSWLQLPWLEQYTRSADIEEDEGTDAYLSDLDLSSGDVFELDDAACEQLTSSMMEDTQLLSTNLFEYSDVEEGSGWDHVAGLGLGSGHAA